MAVPHGIVTAVQSLPVRFYQTAVGYDLRPYKQVFGLLFGKTIRRQK